MTVFQIIALLLTLAAIGAYVNYRLLKLPSSVGMMMLALTVSLVAMIGDRFGLVSLASASAFVAQIDFPNILLHGMLSFLLFAGALHIDIADLKKRMNIVVILATVGTAIATFVTGSLIWFTAQTFGFSIPYLHALLFGALIAPTDALAVMSTLKDINMPRTLKVKLGSESLLNDGMGVVLFLILLAAITQPQLQLAPINITLMLLWAGAGSVVLGLTLGWITHQLLSNVNDYKTEVLLTLALVSGGYSLAEAVHVSAPVAVVVAGLVVGNHGAIFGVPHTVRNHVDMFWSLTDEVLNAVLFMLMGLEMLVVKFTPLHMAMGMIGIFAVIIGRFVSVAVPVSVMRLRYRFERGTIALLTWGGLRGGISIALALSLPPFPEKDVILGMTYIVVMFSVLFQGTTFRPIAKMIFRE